MIKVKRLRAGDMCEYEDCEAEATDLAQGREYVGRPSHPGVRKYCLAHAETVEEEGFPEYTQMCPNCSCRMGVN